jgi:hypothetical protein
MLYLVQLDWFIKGWVVCELPFFAPKRPVGIIRKE